MTDTTRLPPLPETRYVIGIESDGYNDDRCTNWPAWDEDMVKAYGAECRRMALEEAAQAMERIKPGTTLDIVLQAFADSIRALKDKA